MSKGMEWKKYKDIAGAPGLSREKWNKIYPMWFVECVWPVVADFLERNRDRIGARPRDTLGAADMMVLLSDGAYSIRGQKKSSGNSPDCAVSKQQHGARRRAGRAGRARGAARRPGR